MTMIVRFSIFALLISTTCWALPAGMDATDDKHVTITASDGQSVELEFRLSDLDRTEIVTDGETSEYQYITGEGSTYEWGKPILPAISRFIVVPADAGIQLSYEADEPRIEQAQHSPTLCFEEGMDQDMDDVMNGNYGLYPPQFVEISEPTVVRGVRMVKVTTYPVQYNSITDSYLYRDHITTELQFTDDEPVNPAFHPVRRNRSQQFLKTIREIAINGDEVGRDDPDFEPDYIGHYLVVAHQNCVEYSAEFIEWRRKSGYKMDIYSVPSNQSTNTGAIKSGIQNRYDAYLDDGIDPFDELMIIGDRQSYSGDAGGAGWQIGAETGESIWANPPHADYKYSLLEGGNNDRHPDVGLSRWCAGDRNKLELFSGRTMGYEAHPYMEDTDWFTRGAVYSQHWGNSVNSAWHITVHTNVRWAEEVLEQHGFDDIRFHEVYEWDQQGQRVGPFVRDLYNEGVNLLLGRAENYYWRSSFQGVDNNAEVFPLRLVTSGHGEWTTWNSLRGGGASGNNLKGPVASTCGWGGPATTAMSVIWLELVNGVVQRDLTLGWGRVMALINLERSLSNFNFRNQSVYNQTKTDFDCYGDPGLQPWMGVPQRVEVDYPEAITPDTRMVDVYVFDPADETDVAGAQVTVYAPGDMPDFDDNDYATYDEMQMWTTKTDSNGMANFVFPEGTSFEEGTPLYVTVTGRTILPYFGESDIGVPRKIIELNGYELTETEGNEDGDVNPGETFELTLSAVNSGSRDEAIDVTAIVRSISPWVEVSEDTLSFGDIDNGDQSDGEGSVTLNISSYCPDGESRPITKPVLIVTFLSGESRWQSAIKLAPVAPNFELNQVVGGRVVPTDEDEYDLDIQIRNIGGMDAPVVSAELRALGIGVTPVRETASYPQIDAGRSGRIEGNAFVVTGNRIVVPGSATDMVLILRSEDGFVDSVEFNLQVGESGRNKPQGPDGFGYICFDDTDDDWDIAPEYDWLEISTQERNRDYNGVECDFEYEERIEYVGETQVVDLGFETQFYGEVYDQISICTNGFVCLGNQPRITNFQNWPMDRAMAGGAGMIAALWDWLKFTDDSAIYYYYDEDENRFIVEWYKVRHKNGGNSDLTFQVIIYDKDVWVTETGDPNILIQYKSVENVRGANQADYYIPYASVGISSPDGTTGINYTFNNDYPETSAPLENRRALLFATSPKYRSGILYGWVNDARTGDPIENAIVVTEHGIAARTDEDGFYRVPNALAEIAFDITARKLGYNDSTLTDTIIIEDDSAEVSFDLLHPEFESSQGLFHSQLDPDFETELGFTVANDGNGPMDWSLRKRLPGNADVDPWRHRESLFVGDTTGNPKMKGVIWANNHFYCTGGGRARRDDNVVYVFDRDGRIVDQYPQFGNSVYGMSDLAWDGGLLWGGEENTMYGFTPSGELVSTFHTQLDENQAITWDSDRQLLWVADKVPERIIGFDREGQEQFRLHQLGLRTYGMGYWPDDPDGYPLYIFHSIVVNEGDDLTMVHKMNPETGDTLFVADLGTEADRKPEGVHITNQYDVYSWVFISMANIGRHDQVDIWQLDARRDWYRLFDADDEADNRTELFSGHLDAGDSQDFTLFLNSYDLPRVTFEGQLLFSHNAAGGSDTLFIQLDVIGNVPPEPFDLIYPGANDTLNANNLDETVFTWEESNDPNWGDIIRYQLWLQSGEDSMLVGAVDSSSMSVDLLALSNLWPDDPLHSLTWWIVADSDPDRVESGSRHSFQFIPNTTVETSSIPVEFELQSIYPSPFNGLATISYGMDRTERVLLRAYDISGREVATLLNQTVRAGNHQVSWRASSLPSGVYLLRLESAGRIKMSKVALVK